MTRRYRLVIEIDDIDRDQDPDLPWTANVVHEETTGFEAHEGGGVGRDPIAAIGMLIDEFLTRTKEN